VACEGGRAAAVAAGGGGELELDGEAEHSDTTMEEITAPTDPSKPIAFIEMTKEGQQLVAAIEKLVEKVVAKTLGGPRKPLDPSWKSGRARPVVESPGFVRQEQHRTGDGADKATANAGYSTAT